MDGGGSTGTVRGFPDIEGLHISLKFGVKHLGQVTLYPSVRIIGRNETEFIFLTVFLDDDRLIGPRSDRDTEVPIFLSPGHHVEVNVS